MPTVYVLQCEKNRYYVGKSDRPIETRISEHFANNGSEFTRLYKPIRVVEVVSNADVLDEDKYTKAYMIKHGIDRVRGGSYSMVELPNYKIQALRDELCTAENRCYRCMRKGHFGNNCYARTMVDGEPITDTEIMQQSSFRQIPQTRQIVCYRCNRAGHYANDCYARTQQITSMYQTYGDSDDDSDDY
jgi:predicted GIY-YIG superfamily endonuclease